jgi:hypothetical protein
MLQEIEQQDKQAFFDANIHLFHNNSMGNMATLLKNGIQMMASQNNSSH